jgi:hypothetical protein
VVSEGFPGFTYDQDKGSVSMNGISTDIDIENSGLTKPNGFK